MDTFFSSRVANIPNALTFVRIASILFLGVTYILPFYWAHSVAAIIFAVAAATDWLDGFLARRWQQTTRFGAFLDPVADKLIVCIALVLVVSSPEISYLVLPACVIIGREIVISALREWMAEIGRRTSVAVSFVGKLKTLLQMVALFLLLWYHPASSAWFRDIGLLLIYLAAMLTVWSMIMYLRVAWPDLTLSEDT